ncbi:MAG: hypothetical protein OXC91_14985 [Rhodobacteraceae bacterium]|nr:hypothetical protein [Paracoccaceae bacterium]
MNADCQASKNDLEFAVEKSIRYHGRMAARYETISKLLMFMVILSGSASFAAFMDKSQFFGAGAAVIAAFALVYSPGNRAARHRNLRNRFSDLAIEIQKSEDSPENLNQWKSKRLHIEQDEPPIFWALEADCCNEVCRARGQDEYIENLRWWPRLTMYSLRHSRSAARIFTDRKAASGLA